MIDRLIENDQDAKLLTVLLAKQRRPYRITIRDGRPRSLDQNQLQWHWAREAEASREGMTATEIQHEWKLIIGVPILRESDPDFSDMWMELTRLYNYQQLLRLMRFIDVTRLMTVTQLKTYLDRVYQYNLEECGIELTKIEDLQLAGQKVDRRVDWGDPRHASTPVGKAAHRRPPGRKVR